MKRADLKPFDFRPAVVSARRRLWRQLAVAARDEAAAAAIQREIHAHLVRLGELAAANVLPRVGVELHRLVVVSLVLLNSATYHAIEKSLHAQPGFASLEAGKAMREFFILRLIQEIGTAVASARPSPRRPLAAGQQWITVGLNPAFVWRLPVFQEPAWEGHYYVLELTRAPITRRLRKATKAAIERFEASLPALSRVERNEILRRALHPDPRVELVS